MNSTHDAISFYRGNSPAFFWGDPNERLRVYETERIYRSQHDPEKPPKWTPGDSYIVIGAIAGLIAGGVVELLAATTILVWPALSLVSSSVLLPEDLSALW
jgi:hypothetical protein